MLQQMIVFWEANWPRLQEEFLDMTTHIGRVANNFILQFLPALHTPFDQDLRTETETLRREIPKFIRVVRETRTKTTESECRAKNDGVTNFIGSSESVIDGRHGC